MERSTVGGGFPLPDAFFPALRLTTAQVERYEWQMRQLVHHALVEYNLHEAMTSVAEYAAGPWSEVAAVDGLTAVESGDRASHVLRVFGRVGGDYRNFVDFFYAETSKQLFEWHQVLFGCAVDAAVLANIHTAASRRPHVYMGVKWVCLQPSALHSKRDSCFLEYMAFTKDLKGRDVGVRVNLPLDIPECPPLPGQLRTKRARTQVVTVARPADGNSSATQLFVMCENDFAGLRMPRAFVKKLMASLAGMTLLADARRLARTPFADPRRWAREQPRKACRICSRAFSAARRRRHCRLCGDVFCARCVVERDTPVWDGPNARRTDFQVVRTKFCKMCVANARFSDMAGLSAAEAARCAPARCHGESSANTEEEEEELEDDDERFSIGLDEDEDQQPAVASSRTKALSAGSTLDTIDDREEDDGKDDDKDDDQDEALSWRGSLDIAEEIDTKDLLAMSRVRRAAEALSRSTVGAGGSGDRAPTSQSISARIAEQEDLLRRMMLAASRGAA